MISGIEMRVDSPKARALDLELELEGHLVIYH